MAGRSTTKTKTTTAPTVEESTVGVNEEEVVVKKTKSRSVKVEPLLDTDEIEVVSLIPNVSYKDTKTNDMYEWEEVGHTEYMTVETLKNMWRNHKGYFRNMWLKANDERIIKQFGLKSTYEKYEYLMNESNYTRSNISKICDAISATPNGLKIAICNRIKNLIQDGEITDIAVIKALEKHLNLDLTSFL